VTAKTKTKDAPLEGHLFEPEPAPQRSKPKGPRSASPTPEDVAAPSQRAVAIRNAKAPSPIATANADASAAFLAMVREVAVSKDLDTEKLKALLAMQTEVMDRQARYAFDEAYAKMAPHLPTVGRNGLIEVREKNRATGVRDGELQQSTKYPLWEDVREAIVPVLARFGFGLRFKTKVNDKGLIHVNGILSGHGWRETSEIELQHDSTGSKNSVQAVKSSQSYGKRICAEALLNFVSRGDDDDGASAGRPLVVGEPFTPEEVEAVLALAIAAELPGSRLLKHMNNKRPKGHPEASEIADLPRSRYQETVDAVAAWEQTRKDRQGGQPPKV
jgi:ERF superfamily protein